MCEKKSGREREKKIVFLYVCVRVCLSLLKYHHDVGSLRWREGKRAREGEAEGEREREGERKGEREKACENEAGGERENRFFFFLLYMCVCVCVFLLKSHHDVGSLP